MKKLLLCLVSVALLLTTGCGKEKTTRMFFAASTEGKILTVKLSYKSGEVVTEQTITNNNFAERYDLRPNSTVVFSVVTTGKHLSATVQHNGNKIQNIDKYFELSGNQVSWEINVPDGN